ncbi:MAG: hypothetical protein Q9163_006413 [Psora crenata]
MAPLDEFTHSYDTDLQGLADIPVMWQPPYNGRHGFLLHADCWSLLNEAFYPRPLPLRRLLDVCLSLRFPLWWNGLDWGHDYGALLRFDNENHYPWEDGLQEASEKSDIHLCARFSPYEDTSIPWPLSETNQLSKSSRIGDCFTRLPWEIREIVATLLPVQEALSLRLASSSFAPILTSQTFWASRFLPGRERDYVFEVRKYRKDIDWMKLFQCTGFTHASSGLRNRIRIWKLVGTSKQYMELQLPKPHKVSIPDDRRSDYRWSRVAGDLSESTPINGMASTKGILALNERCIDVVEALTEIAISVIPAGEADYIAGMRLISTEGHEVQLGYRSESGEITVNVTYLKGFMVAIGPLGIRALKVLRLNGTCSGWIGRVGNAPVTKALSCTSHVLALKVTFDGYKLVALAVGEAHSVTEPVQRSADLSMRNTALWFPTIPDQKLHLNESSFTGELPSTSGYHPLAWILFGGSDGNELSTVTGVTVLCGGIIGSIEFTHATTQNGKQKLGRRRPHGSARFHHFTIDGPGGEIITELATSVEQSTAEGVWSFLKHGLLNSFKVRAKLAD